MSECVVAQLCREDGVAPFHHFIHIPGCGIWGGNRSSWNSNYRLAARASLPLCFSQSQVLCFGAKLSMACRKQFSDTMIAALGHNRVYREGFTPAPIGELD